MRNGARISVIIPALNEEGAIGHVLDDIPTWVDEVLVVDNGSTDRTSEVAVAHGARALREPRKGYGHACLTGMAEMKAPDVVVFLDGDYSDHPQEMDLVVDPILEDRADMVIGSRILGCRERGALTPQSNLGNRLACGLLWLFWKGRCTDLGPFRALSRSALESLEMEEPDYAWTIEMQVKAAQARMRVVEVPVSYRRRIGKSKVSGTVKGVIMASYKILFTIFKMRLQG